MSMQSSKWSFVPAAQQQTRLAPSVLLNSANAGVVIVRRGQIKNFYRHEARVFAHDVSNYINMAQVGVCTVFNYEETFGTQDRIYWLIHMKSLDDYVHLLEMGKDDHAFQEIFTRDRIGADKGYGKWDKMFVDGSFHETVLTAHHWGSHGTSFAKDAATAKVAPDSVLAPAMQQLQAVALKAESVLHSGNAGAILLRSGQVNAKFRSEGREFARDVIDAINTKQAGLATTFLYEEHFGQQDRIHWMTHMRNLGDYHTICQMGTSDEGFRSVFTKQRVAEAAGGGDWSRMFAEGSMQETMLMPQHPLKGC